MKPAAPVTSARTGPPYRRVVSDARSPVALAAAALIAVQMGIRAVLAFGGYFYWDDLILVGKAGTQGLLSPSYLFDDHDGHVMPAAFLVAGVITRLAPLDWTGPAISLVVLQLLASLALLRALYVILGWRPVLLIPLTFALFTPLAVPGFAWWAAALNSLPMLAALAWVCADAILLVRTGNQRYAVTGVLAYSRRAAVLREGRGDPVRRVRRGRTAVPRARVIGSALRARCGGPASDCGWRRWR